MDHFLFVGKRSRMNVEERILIETEHLTLGFSFSEGLSPESDNSMTRNHE
jgi:hypothetical protein